MSPLPLPFAWVLIGSTLSDALVAGILLAYPRDRASTASGAPIGMGKVVFGAAATSLFIVAKVPLLTASGVRPFGLMHLVYVDLVGVIPAVGLSLLAAARFAPARGSRPLISPSVRAAALASLGLLAVGSYATFWEPFRLRCERASVPVAAGRDGRGAVRIGVLADLQTSRVTDYERGAIDRLMALRADVILLPGDLFQGSGDEFERELPALRHLLSRLSAPGGVYFAMGDVDQHPDRVRRMIEGTRVEPLVNRVVRVSVGDRLFSIGGVELDYASKGARATVHQLDEASGDGDIRILLAHRPDVALGLRPKSRIDLTVAGHTHGGQVVVPWLGPPMTLSGVPRVVAAGGLHDLGGNRIYVSRGVGCERGQAPRIRFLCPPELTLLTIGDPPSPE